MPENTTPAVTIELDERHGTARITTETNPVTGRTLYRVTAPRVSGTITVYPVVDTSDPTSHLEVGYDFGNTLQEAHHDTWRPCPEPATINGVEMVGANRKTTIDAIENGTIYAHGLRSRGPYDTTWISDVAGDRLNSVVRAVLRHWITEADIDQLTAAAARVDAATRVREAERLTALLDADIARLTTQRDQAQATAENYRRIATGD
ncbi:hypothetical protein [Amycolatopsis sp. H20-H5]|uniref:hypothetical protein n=1 Tax=Amycolatopsis sp. H20-H5 TaxID=3046309 RepID=UPI002DBF8121|nr:hypothetical protein [Amycolatopsis sp. H20-H5]MEC3977177.1 hypothetical protein [Amycolatopsis sp. H20-H5]